MTPAAKQSTEAHPTAKQSTEAQGSEVPGLTMKRMSKDVSRGCCGLVRLATSHAGKALGLDEWMRAARRGRVPTGLGSPGEEATLLPAGGREEDFRRSIPAVVKHPCLSCLSLPGPAVTALYA